MEHSAKPLTDEEKTMLEAIARIKNIIPPTQVLESSQDIPNGGLNAWLQVVGGFLLLFKFW